MTTTPQRFTKRPITIEAAQLTGDTAQRHAVYLWIEANTLGSFEPLDVIEGRKPYPESGVSIDPRDGRLIISTLEGLHWADEGDWIIRGVQGEFYPCKPDIFTATYQPERIPSERSGGTNADIAAASAVSQAAREEAERRWPLWRHLLYSWDARAMQAAFVDGAQWQADQPSVGPTEAEIRKQVAREVYTHLPIMLRDQATDGCGWLSDMDGVWLDHGTDVSTPSGSIDVDQIGEYAAQIAREVSGR